MSKSHLGIRVSPIYVNSIGHRVEYLCSFSRLASGTFSNYFLFLIMRRISFVFMFN